MASTLVDTNVLFDYLSDDAEWFDWSASMLAEAADRGPIAINQVIYAEVSVRYDRIEALDAALPRDFFIRAELPWEARRDARGHRERAVKASPSRVRAF